MRVVYLYKTDGNIIDQSLIGYKQPGPTREGVVMLLLLGLLSRQRPSLLIIIRVCCHLFIRPLIELDQTWRTRSQHLFDLSSELTQDERFDYVRPRSYGVNIFKSDLVECRPTLTASD